MGQWERGPSTSDIRSAHKSSHAITYKLGMVKPYTNKPTLSMGFYAKNKKTGIEPVHSPVSFCAHKGADPPKKQRDCRYSGKFSATVRKGVRGKPKKGVLRY